jgi:hypothetical protein
MSRITELILELKYELKKVYPQSEIENITLNRVGYEAVRHSVGADYLNLSFDYYNRPNRLELVGIPISLGSRNSDYKDLIKE